MIICSDDKEVSRENFHSKLLITLLKLIIEFMDLEIISTISIDWRPCFLALLFYFLSERRSVAGLLETISLAEAVIEFHFTEV